MYVFSLIVAEELKETCMFYYGICFTIDYDYDRDETYVDCSQCSVTKFTMK